jgi:hypothetical protein
MGEVGGIKLLGPRALISKDSLKACLSHVEMESQA